MDRKFRETTESAPGPEVQINLIAANVVAMYRARLSHPTPSAVFALEWLQLIAPLFYK
jgi:hypothetical protein